MQFVASLAGSLAWPAAVVIIILVMKKPIIERLASLLKVTLPGGISAEFAEEVEVLTALDVVGSAEQTESVVASAGATRAAPPALPPVDSSDVPDSDALRANPTGVVMESWKSLERTLRDAVRAVSPDAVERIGIIQVFHVLLAKNFINQEELSVLRKTLQLRNLAAHSDEPISAESAAEFKRLVISLDARYRERIELLK